MLIPVAGDLLLSRAELLAHGVAPNDDFKNGLALALRERFPAMYKDFRHWCKTIGPKAGMVWTWGGVTSTGKSIKIAALLTQEPPAHAGGHPGPAHLEYVNRALHELRKIVVNDKVESLSLPRLATGVGGLDWKDVRALIEKTLGTLPVPVYLYESYVKGLAAKEAGVA